MTSRDANAQITLTPYLYTPTAIAQTIREFHELCGVESETDGDSTIILFRPKAESPSTVSDDFLNYALELSALEILRGEE